MRRLNNTRTIIQILLKQYIIRLRPNFLAQCRPVPDRLDAQFLSSARDPGQFPLFVNISVCEADQIELSSSMKSFPSGHTGSAFAAGIFLALYLNAKLKAFADCGTPFWKMMVVVAPVLGAMVIAAGLVIDKVCAEFIWPDICIRISAIIKSSNDFELLQHHHVNDVLLSSLIGIACALLAYRSQYRSLFTYADNHIPFISSLSTQPLLPLSSVSHINVSERNDERGQFLAVRWPKRNRVGKLVNEGIGDRSLRLDGADGSHTVEMVGGLEDDQRGVVQHGRGHGH